MPEKVSFRMDQVSGSGPHAGGRSVAGSFRLERRAGAPDADLPGRSQVVHEPAAPGRSYSFRLMTSCSISLSSDRSATIRFRRPFSSSSWRSRFISDGISPPYFFRQT